MTTTDTIATIRAIRSRIVELDGLTKEQRRAVAARRDYQAIKRSSAQIMRALANAAEDVHETGAASLDLETLLARMKAHEVTLNAILRGEGITPAVIEPKQPAEVRAERSAELLATRQLLGWSLSYLADRLGVDVRTVRRWEAGTHEASLEALELVRRELAEAMAEARAIVEGRERSAVELCIARAASPESLDRVERHNAKLRMAATITMENGIRVEWTVRDLLVL